jgi:SAM-dependent methyltransferase
MISLLRATPLWPLLRGVKRRLAVPHHDRELPGESCRGVVEWLNPRGVLEAGETFTTNLRITNQSDVAWTSHGTLPVTLVLTWRRFDGECIVVPVSNRHEANHKLPRSLYPGEPFEFAFQIAAPQFVGDFLLTIDLAQDEPFSRQNSDSKCVKESIAVVGSRRTDIDYHAVYRTANLNDNHWWVVGQYREREAYEKSQRERLYMLQQQGLTPDSHLLDIGCGTGQMAGVLRDFLTDRGGYAGTDIGVEAIAFCKNHHRRDNFRFAVGGMTTVPFADNGTFDMAILFSVFTHTFTDESALLLGEAARLLKPNGMIIADIITSDLVERGSGHRGEMIVNFNHFVRLAKLAGFTCHEFAQWPWNPHATRRMLRMERL